MALSIQLDKTWIIECKGDLGSRTVRGGICVMKKGIILTSWFDLTRNNLRGRNHGSDIWFKLKILKEKPNFGLALLKVEKVLKPKEKSSEGLRVKKPKEKSSAGLRFSSFNLKKHMKKKVDLKRGDMVEGVFHREDNPFASFFGYSCCPFRVEDVEFPCMESEFGLSEIGDAREEVFTSPIPYLCTKHIITVLPNSDGDGVCYSGDDKDDGSDNIGGGVCRSGDDKDAGNNNISESDNVSDNDFDSDSDADDEYDLERLHPDIPLIQVHGLGSGLGSHGCPVFKHKNIIGMFYFTSSGYQYVLSISFLYAFLSHLISSRKKRRLLRKRTRKESVSKPTKMQKSDSASAAPPSENPGVQRPKTPQPDASDQPQAGQTSVALGLLKVHCAPLNCAGSKLDALDDTALYYAAGCRRQERVLFLGNKTAVADVTALAKRHADGSLPIEDYNIQLDEQRGHLMESETDQGAIKMDLMPHTKVKELISAQRFDALEVLDMEEPQVSDETWSLEDVECAVNIFKEAKDNKAEKLADDQKCRVEIKEQKCGKTLLAKADDMQKLDPLVSNSFENVAAEALWRHKNDALKALDDLTNRVTKSKIQSEKEETSRACGSKSFTARVHGF